MVRVRVIMPWVVLGLTVVTATEIVWEKDLPFMGLPPTIQVGESQWRSPTMVWPQKFTDSDRIRSGSEFFAMEYGTPCVFDHDWLKDEGYASGPYRIENGALVFDTGDKGFSFGFGPEPGDKNKPALRFGSGWGKQIKDNYRLRMVLDQSLPETKWKFTPGNEKGYELGRARNFVVKGEGPTVFEGDIGLVRECLAFPRIMFTCETSGVAVRVKSLEIFPTSGEIFFRRRFDLETAPVMTRCSFRGRVIESLHVNGKTAFTSPGVYPGCSLRNLDLAPYLKTGKNVIAYEGQIVDWAGVRPELLFEGVAVSEDGALTRILGDTSWKCSLQRRDGWEQPDFDDGDWLSPRLEEKSFETELADGTKVFYGVNPLPMGVLEVAPEGRKYPLFELGETPRFLVKLPAGLAGKVAVSVTVCEGGTDNPVTELAISSLQVEGGLARGVLELKDIATGPYRLNWRVRDTAGETLETQVGELVVVGPIPQESLALTDFEGELEKRLRPVRHIDCAALPAESDGFVDHAGMYNQPKVNKGKVVSSNGLSYRETGDGHWDYFAYRLQGLERGQPYLAEVVVPDDADRYIYSGVLETYPANFCNNLARWGLGWFNATGTCYTGLNSPLSGKTKTIRYVFFPASMNSAIVVMSGFAGHPAAACTINIYKIEDGLPALALPETDRLFGAHNERLSLMALTTGMCEQPLINDKGIRLCPRQDGWFQLYRMFERKICLLRFRGQNMSVEGAYMYTNGEYPSVKHCPFSGTDSVDPLLLLLKMYRRNGVKCLLGFEYFRSPQVDVQGKDGVSDRRMWQGDTGTRLVDRHGRQLVGYMNNGWNFLNPDIAGILLDCVSELRERYTGEDVAGLFLVNGYWWLPTFNTQAYPELTDLEVGYGDCTVDLFEKESGVNLGVDSKDPGRFEKRYQALSGTLLDQWKLWRAKKLRDFIVKIADTVQWPVYSYPCVNTKMSSPFYDPKAGREDRDAFYAQRCADYARPLDLYLNSETLHLVPRVSSLGKYADRPEESFDPLTGLNRSRSVRRAIENAGMVYVGIASGLDEVDCPATAAPRSVFTRTTRGVFIPRGAGDCAMREFVEAVDGSTPPRIVFDNWYDCNMSTAFGPQLRRFAAEFYAIPDGARFTPLEATGVEASTCAMPDGSACLRLVNATPYPVEGQVQIEAETVTDQVYGNTLDSRLFSGGRRAVTLKPFDLRLFNVRGLKKQIRCEFAFPREVTSSLRTDARFILGDKGLLRKVPGDLVARLFDGLEKGNAFDLYTVMTDFECAAQVRLARKNRAALDNQAKFLAALDKGIAKINCACPLPYGDWLPDQTWQEDIDAYGNIGGNAVDRGKIEIKDTDIPRVYQTELYGGQVEYRVPVPDSAYTVRLHFAETYINNTEPGGRLITVSVEGKVLPERIDPIKLAGTWGKPYVLELNKVQIFDKSLDIVLTGNVEINGIEIERGR